MFGMVYTVNVMGWTKTSRDTLYFGSFEVFFKVHTFSLTLSILSIYSARSINKYNQSLNKTKNEYIVSNNV